MASFLGHDITVHRSFYRLSQETLQVARMGRLLTAFNNGTVGQYSGKSLDEIPLDESKYCIVLYSPTPTSGHPSSPVAPCRRPVCAATVDKHYIMHLS
ncbi:hypothetical protein DPMN_048235 [Dreissena polymorpha]|uniref:Uncharacterized protein n=1 Tax=Dreissena polymorpha TaxID=45954 RepID=A0A9D4DAE8_DREPO|nr:hypothetical protein DPMN_048235 [Dreissena polymorpha]